MKAPLYGFGLSQEDERTERAGLRLRGGERVLCSTGGGEMPLAMLTFGASTVTTVDIDPAQSRLARLKLAAACALPREAAIRFVGYAPDTAERRARDWLEVRRALSPGDVAFWEARRDALEGGAIWAGRFERYVGLLEQFVWPLLGRWRIEGLFQQPDLASQARWFDARVGTRWLRAALRVAFSPALYRGRGVQDASLSRVEGGEPLGERFFRELRDVCTRTPARDNPLLQLMLLGRVLDVDHVPAWISAEGQAALRARAADLTFVDGDVIDLLRAAPPASFDALHLSNVSDWVDDARWSELLRGVLHAARPGARVVWRRMHAEHAVPEEVARGFARDDAAGMALRAADRFPFYAIHVAEVR